MNDGIRVSVKRTFASKKCRDHGVRNMRARMMPRKEVAIS